MTTPISGGGGGGGGRVVSRGSPAISNPSIRPLSVCSQREELIIIIELTLPYRIMEFSDFGFRISFKISESGEKKSGVRN